MSGMFRKQEVNCNTRKQGGKKVEKGIACTCTVCVTRETGVRWRINYVASPVNKKGL